MSPEASVSAFIGLVDLDFHMIRAADADKWLLNVDARS